MHTFFNKVCLQDLGAYSFVKCAAWAGMSDGVIYA